MATTRIGFWTWTWSTRHCGLGHKAAYFNAGKTQLVSFDWSNNNGAIDVKWMSLFLRKNHFLRCWELTFSSNLNWSSWIISIAKSASEKSGALICSMKFLSPEVAMSLCKSNIWPCMEYCCTMSGLVLLVAT